MDQDFDFVVVGSGFGGSVSALRLAERGYKVAVVEAGRRWKSEDFPRTNWSVRKFLWMPRLLCYGIQRLSLLDDVLVLSGAGVGGGSLVYANTLLVPPLEAFQNPGWPKDRDWGQALAPHFATARRMLGVVEVPDEFPADRLLRRAAEEAGVAATFRRQQVGVFFGRPGETVPDPYFGGAGPARAGCNLCGGCMVGCRHNAKNTLDKNYLYLAERAGAVVIPETEVTLLSPRPEGGYHLELTSTTRPIRRERRALSARRVVLSAGVLGTLRLLMRSRERGLLPRLSPMLGRRVRTNSESIIGSTARRGRVSYSEGVAIASSVHIDGDTHVEPVRYSRGSDVMSFLGTLLADGGGGVPRAVRWMGEVARHPVDFLRTLSPFGWAERTVILLVMQSKENSVDLSWRRRWFAPLSRAFRSERAADNPRIPTYIKSANDFARIVARLQDGFPSSAINEVLLDVPTTAHILGGCAMALSPEEGVIDTKNEVFGYPGLFVVDGSMLPSNLGVNPSLTITALAEHAMSQVPPKV